MKNPAPGEGAGQGGDFGAEIETTHNRPPATRQANPIDIDDLGTTGAELIGDDLVRPSGGRAVLVGEVGQ
jgi:hypothetical protein